MELGNSKIKFGREVDQPIFYNDIMVGSRRVNFVIEDRIKLEDVHLAQAKNYVVPYNYEKGLLINFGSQSLQYKLFLIQGLIL